MGALPVTEATNNTGGHWPTGAEHGAEANIGDIILHHVLDAKILSIKILGIDFSITKHVLMMWIAAALVVFVFRYAFREQRIIPSGVANLLEAMIVFLRDEVVLPNMGEEGRHYLPYLLSVSFFAIYWASFPSLPLLRAT